MQTTTQQVTHRQTDRRFPTRQARLASDLSLWRPRAAALSVAGSQEDPEWTQQQFAVVASQPGGK